MRMMERGTSYHWEGCGTQREWPDAGRPGAQLRVRPCGFYDPASTGAAGRAAGRGASGAATDARPASARGRPCARGCRDHRLIRRKLGAGPIGVYCRSLRCVLVSQDCHPPVLVAQVHAPTRRCLVSHCQPAVCGQGTLRHFGVFSHAFRYPRALALARPPTGQARLHHADTGPAGVHSDRPHRPRPAGTRADRNRQDRRVRAADDRSPAVRGGVRRHAQAARPGARPTRELALRCASRWRPTVCPRTSASRRLRRRSIGSAEEERARRGTDIISSPRRPPARSPAAADGGSLGRAGPHPRRGRPDADIPCRRCADPRRRATARRCCFQPPSPRMSSACRPTSRATRSAWTCRKDR